MRVPLTRPNFQRGLKVRDRFVQFTAVDAQVAEIIMGNIVIRGHSKSMGPKRLAVTPVGSLNECRPCQGNNDHYVPAVATPSHNLA